MVEKEEQKLKEQLATLSPMQREVLHRVCQGVAYKEIASELVIAEGTVKTHMYQVYIKLDLDFIKNPHQRQKKLRETYCPLLSQEDLPPPPAEAEKLLPVPPEVPPQVEEDQKALVVWQPRSLVLVHEEFIDPPVKGTESGKTPNSLRLLVIGITLGVVPMAILLCIFMGLTYQYTLMPVVQVTTVSRIITVEVTVVQPTASPVVLVVTSTPLPVSPTPKLTNTPRATTDTPQPSATATLSGGFAFEDNFETGLDPNWRVLSGDPIVADGKLGTAGGGVTVEIGDSSWSNYTVDFDFINNFCPSIHLIVAQSLRYDFCVGDWSAFKDNNWDVVAEGLNPPRTGHLRLVSSGNSYTIFINGVQFFDIKYGQPRSGPFAIAIGDSSNFIDNVVITSP